MSTQKTNTQVTDIQPNEIDLLQVAKTLWEGRRIIIRTTVVFIFLGLLVVLFSHKEYTSSTTMIPQLSTGQSNFNGLSGLASIAGVNINTAGSADIPPSIYPQIVASIPFGLELMQTTLTFKKPGQPVTLYDYYTKHHKPNLLVRYTIGLPGILMKAIRDKPGKASSTDNGLITLTQEQQEIQEKLNKIIYIDYNDKDGYVTLTCSMPEPLPAAQLAHKAQELLQHYITEFKIQKATANLEFIQQRYYEVQQQYNQVQEELALFRDRNKNVSTAMAMTEFDRINNNYTLIYGLYSELARQLEQAKIKVKEDTPVFTVIEPVSVPLRKSKPKRARILTISAFLGIIVGTGVIFGRQIFASIKL